MRFDVMYEPPKLDVDGLHLRRAMAILSIMVCFQVKRIGLFGPIIITCNYPD